MAHATEYKETVSMMSCSKSKLRKRYGIEWKECLQYSHKFIASAIKYLANKHTASVWKEVHKQLINNSA